jgi:hypothetical protein
VQSAVTQQLPATHELPQQKSLPFLGQVTLLAAHNPVFATHRPVEPNPVVVTQIGLLVYSVAHWVSLAQALQVCVLGLHTCPAVVQSLVAWQFP